MQQKNNVKLISSIVLLLAFFLPWVEINIWEFSIDSNACMIPKHLFKYAKYSDDLYPVALISLLFYIIPILCIIRIYKVFTNQPYKPAISEFGASIIMSIFFIISLLAILNKMHQEEKILSFIGFGFYINIIATIVGVLSVNESPLAYPSTYNNNVNFKSPTFKFNNPFTDMPNIILKICHLSYLKQENKIQEDEYNVQKNKLKISLKKILFFGFVISFIYYPYLFLILQIDYHSYLSYNSSIITIYQLLIFLIPVSLFLLFKSKNVFNKLLISNKSEKSIINQIFYSFFYSIVISVFFIMVVKTNNFDYGDTMMYSFIGPFHFLLILFFIIFYKLYKLNSNIFCKKNVYTILLLTLFYIYLYFVLIYLNLAVVNYKKTNILLYDIYAKILDYFYYFYYFVTLLYIILFITHYNKFVNNLVEKITFLPIEKIAEIEIKPQLSLHQKAEILNQIENVHNLYSKGVINEETYNQMKTPLLLQIENSAKNEKEIISNEQSVQSNNNKIVNYVKINCEENNINNNKKIIIPLIIIIILSVFVFLLKYILPIDNNRFIFLDMPQTEMVFVQGGTFTMGCTDEQGSDCDDNEKPAHQVTLSDYYIGKYEVTQGLWKKVMGNNPSRFTNCGDDCPVENVSWDDCQEFISKLNQLTGKRFRLPTEAEWEYAARGGRDVARNVQQTKYAGSNALGEVAWNDENSDVNYSGGYEYKGRKLGTHTVGTKKPNALGIYDMSGNVWEWCNDWYGDYSSGGVTNPKGASTGSNRDIRGGSWADYGIDSRVSNRGYNYPSYGYYNSGIRLVFSSY